MKVTIVNECSFFTENLLPYLQQEFSVSIIKRSCEFLDKTIGLAWRVLKSNADVYHVNYALQDAFIVQKLKHLHILFCHGSDVRTTQYGKYGWIVKSNLKHADKVLYTNLDSPLHLKSRPDAEYMPVPVNTAMFTPKRYYNNPVKALYMPKKTDVYDLALTELMEKVGIKLSFLNRCFSHAEMPELLSRFDVFVDTCSIRGNSTLGLEAMSCGLALVDFRHWHDLASWLEYLADSANVQVEGEKNRRYVVANHDAKLVAGRLAGVWREFA